MKIGAITVGQSPRTDVTVDIEEILGSQVELIEGGGLDGLTKEEIQAMTPEKGDYVLVSHLRDNTSATFGEKYVLPRIQAQIERMEAMGVELIMMFCTGTFPDTIHASVPLIYPCELLERLVPLLTRKSHLIVVTPSSLQVEQAKKKWEKYVEHVDVIAASPYGTMEGIMAGAQEAANLPGDLIVLDCIGFSQKMKAVFHEKTGKAVVLPRTLLARIISEVTDEGISESY